MKKQIMVLLIAGILIFGCLGGGGQQASPSPAAAASAVAANIDPQLEQQTQAAADDAAQLDELTRQLDADMKVTDEDLKSLG
ncbi:MAG: hypothetical protein V1835_04840 [Candidatus Micrarchaeota archaeon]